jgi:flagellar biosynthesis chaperone FliJ
MPTNPFDSRLAMTQEVVKRIKQIMQTINEYNEEMNKYLFLDDNDVLFDWFNIPNNLNTLNEVYLKITRQFFALVKNKTITPSEYFETLNILVLKLDNELKKLVEIKTNYNKLESLFSKSKENIETLSRETFKYMGLAKTKENFDQGMANNIDSNVENFFRLLEKAIITHNDMISVFLQQFVDFPPTTEEYTKQETFLEEQIDETKIEITNILFMISKPNAPLDDSPRPTGFDSGSKRSYAPTIIVGGLKRRRSKFPSYKYYVKAFKSYSKRKLKTFRKRRNYKKTKRGKH